MSINQQEQALFQEWSNTLGVTMDEFVSDGLLFRDGLIFDGVNWVRIIPKFGLIHQDAF